MARKRKNALAAVLVAIIITVICVTVSILSDGSKEFETDSEVNIITAEQISGPQNNMIESAADITAEDSEEEIPEEVISERMPEAKTDMEICEEQAEEILAKMSLEEKVYQMFIVTPEQLTGVETVTAAGNTTRESLQKYPVGGLIYFKDNLINKDQTSEMLRNSQKYALEISGMPLFLCVDEEGGKVARISNNASFGFEKIKPMKEIKSEEEAYGAGSTIGGYLTELGFNVDFAPDADVITNPQNTVIGDRSFGDDPELVTNYAAVYSDGLHLYGVLSTFKHFPGHGATAGDTHEGFAYTNKTLEELKQSELLPFIAAQDKGVDMVMISHISVPQILGDNTPCTLSRYMVTDVLKGELGYKGLIVTDAMNMGAITNTYGGDQAVVDAVKAGIDLILMPVDLKSAVNAVVAAVESGEVEMDSIDESVRKIVVKKLGFI